MTPLSATKEEQAKVGGMFLPMTSASSGTGNFLPYGTPPATPTPTSSQGKHFDDLRWEEARCTAAIQERVVEEEGEGSTLEDGNAIGEEEQAVDDVVEGAKLESNTSKQFADDEVGETRYYLGQRMLSPEGLLVKKVLRQGIAYPVRLRLLVQQPNRCVCYGDIDYHQRPPFSLSLTWLEGDDCGLDLCGVTSVRPGDHSSNTQLEDGSGPRDNKAVNIERGENAEDNWHHEKSSIYDRHAHVRRPDSSMMLLLAWDLEEREPGLGVDKTVACSDSGRDLLRLEAASEQERDALVGCFQQLVSELKRGREGREDDTWSIAGSVGEPEDEDGCNSSSVEAGTQGDRTVLQDSGVPEGSAEPSERIATSTTKATATRERAAEAKPPAGGGVRPRKSPHLKTRRTETDGVEDHADPASSDDYGADGDCSGEGEESNGLRRKIGAQNCSGLNSRSHHQHHQQQCEASFPAGSSPKPPPPLPPRTTRKTRSDTAKQHDDTADAACRPSASRRPPRGTQRYWPIGGVATKPQSLRRRRSAGVRTPSGEYIGGNLSRGASLGPRNSMFLSSASVGAEIGQAGRSGGELFWEQAVLDQRKQELSARILRLHERWRDDSRVAAWAVGVSLRHF